MAKEQLLAEFDKCPVCGSKKRLMEELVNEEKEKNKLGAEVTPCLLKMSSIATTPKSQVLVGQTVSVGTAVTDVCLDCGTIYATKIYRGEALLQAQPMRGGMPPPGMMGG